MNEYDIVNSIATLLNLKNILTEEQINDFINKIGIKLLDNSNSGNTLGRTKESTLMHFENFVEFLKIINCTEEEIVKVIYEEPTLVMYSIDAIIEKYFILNLVSTDEKVKKEFLLKYAKELIRNSQLIIRRSKMLEKYDYPEKYTFKLLFRNTTSEFFKIFTISEAIANEDVNSKKYKSYKKKYYYKNFKSDEKNKFNEILNEIEVNEDSINEVINLEINKELIEYYYMKKTRNDVNRK